MPSFTVIFATPDPSDPCLTKPGWTTITHCLDIDDAIEYFYNNRERLGVPAVAVVDSVRRDK